MGALVCHCLCCVLSVHSLRFIGTVDVPALALALTLKELSNAVSIVF